MAEQLDLTAPVTQPSIAGYTVSSLTLDWSGQQIVIALRDNTGKMRSFTYQGSRATSMMIALNKANLTNNSLQKRIFTQLVSDGELSGTVSGSPE